MALNVQDIRRQFPLLKNTVNGKPIVYLDSAATTPSPVGVLDRMRTFEEEERSNVHRGMHLLAEQATEQYEAARQTVQRFIGARHQQEIIFTKNGTESINLVARCMDGKVGKGDRIVLTLLEHHSNIVPWMQLAERRGLNIDWIGIDAEGHLKMEECRTFLAQGNVKLVAVTAQSNVLGVRPPLEEIIRAAHGAGAAVLVDAAQFAAHHRIDVQALDCDFLAFSGHKIYGPTGIGVLFGKRELLEEMPPFLGGGSMIHTVTQTGFMPADPPQKFEAGTPPITQAIGLRAAIDWLNAYEWKEIEMHEQALITLACKELGGIPGIRIVGLRRSEERSGCVSFTVENMHPHDLTHLLGEEGICLRAGHHCTQPLHKELGVPATTRLSVGIYSVTDDIHRCIIAIQQAAAILQR